MNLDDVPAGPMTPPRFIIGIDLGTTNCAVAFVDTKAGRDVRDFPVRQLTAPGVHENRDTLPSFLLMAPGEDDFCAGVHARDQGALMPGRQISSAKSWLCHQGVDRMSPILPWHAAEGVTTLSPVEAQARILLHLVEAWNAAHPAYPLAGQDVYITVPASFDEVARELTVAAAKKAGIPRLHLLEEPQAAFYAWLSQHASGWETIVRTDDHVLVIDVGGGTTDLTLIHARPAGDGRAMFHRTAVGDHLILGGDNLDLALAHALESRLVAGDRLDPSSWSTLVRLCRHHKEVLLGPGPPDEVTVVVPGRGSSILGGQRQAVLSRDEAHRLLVDGFMPRVTLQDSPARRSSGFQEFGLPYASDPAISRYLAEFLRENLPQRDDGTLTPPAAILLNGGLFESAHMRERVMELLTSWFAPAKPLMLDHRRLDLAVARGAAYYGLTGRGEGVRVVSNLARSYYIGVEGPGARAICLAPAGLSSGSRVALDKLPLKIRLKTPASFPVYVSSRRTTDLAGAIVELDDDSFTALPPIRTVLTAGKQATQAMIDVTLSVTLTELGTLDLQIAEMAGSRTWKLAFDVRAATRTDLSYHQSLGEETGLMESARVHAASALLHDLFDQPASVLGQVAVFKQLENCLGLARDAWPVSLLRSLWESLHIAMDVRNRSHTHEQRWMNLTGYCLRPGFGLAIDDWRVAEMWKIFHRGPVHRTQEVVRAEWWIFWRRLAGGLSAGQQQSLGAPILAACKQFAAGKTRARLSTDWEIRPGDHETRELVRLAAVLERLTTDQKHSLASSLIDASTPSGSRIGKDLLHWAIGRIGTRAPGYGPIHHVISADLAEKYILQLIAPECHTKETNFSLTLLARRTGDRYRDIAENVRNAVLESLLNTGAPDHWITLVRDGGNLDNVEAGEILGERLPMGLVLT